MFVPVDWVVLSQRIKTNPVGGNEIGCHAVQKDECDILRSYEV